MSSEDLSCVFCKPKKLFLTWVDLKTHLEQHVIEASIERPCKKKSCSNCTSTCTSKAPSSTVVPVSLLEPFKKTEDTRKVVGLVRPVPQQPSCTPSTSFACAAGDAGAHSSSIPEPPTELSSIVINVKGKWVPAASSDTGSSAPLLIVASPQIDATSSQIHTPQRVLSILPLEKKMPPHFASVPLLSGLKKSFVDGVENIATFQDTDVIQANPLTKLSIIHSKAAVDTLEGSLSYIKIPPSVSRQGCATNTIALTKEEWQDARSTASEHSSLSNLSITSQISESKIPHYNHGNLILPGSSNVNCRSFSQSSTILVETPMNINQEQNCYPGMVILPSGLITSTSLRNTTHSPNTKVFHVLGNTTTMNSTTTSNNICLSSCSLSPSGTFPISNPCDAASVSCERIAGSWRDVPSLTVVDPAKHGETDSHISVELSSVTSVPEKLSSSYSSAFAPSNICSAIDSSSTSVCSIAKIGSCVMPNNMTNSSGGESIVSSACERRLVSMTTGSEEKEEEVDDPQHNITEDETSVERVDKTKGGEKTSQKFFECKKCDATFSSRRAALVHQAQAHGKPRAFECADCGRSFSSSHNLTIHSKHRHACGTGRREPALCTVCGKSFASKSNLMLHARLHSGERPFVCSVCKKSFSRKCTLEKHSLYHTGERRYTCDRCGAGFYTSHSLSRHIKLHDGERSFACDECDANYVVMSDLKRHKLSHAAVKPFSCELCPKTFSRKHDLNVHALYHARSSRFSCEFCERQFVEESNYKRHVRQHTGEKPYQCNACGVRYSQLHHVKKHLQTCHRDTLKTTTAAGSVALPLYSGAYSVPHSKSRNRKGYLEKISSAVR